MEAPTGPQVERDIEIEKSPGDVWSYLIEDDLISTWMGGEVEFQPRVGGAIEMGPIWGTIEELDAPHRIQWSWRTDDGLPSLVEIELEPIESGTRLTVRETLLPWTISGPNESFVASLAA